MRILAKVFDAQKKQVSEFYLNNATADIDPLCGIEACPKTLGWSHPYCDAHLRKMFGVEVRPSKIHGMGLFACRAFESRAKKSSYFNGEVFASPEELDRRYSSSGDNDCIALYTIQLRNEYVDALRLRHAWAYANHSDDANCKYGEKGIVAVRAVSPGDEILVNYGKAYEIGCGFVTHTVEAGMTQGLKS